MDFAVSWKALLGVEARITTREEEKDKKNKDERCVGHDCQDLCSAICEQVCTWKMNGRLFSQISANVVSSYPDSRSSHLPRKDGTLSSQFMKHSG